MKAWFTLLLQIWVLCGKLKVKNGCKKKKQKIFLHFKKAKAIQLTISNAFPGQDFIWTPDINNKWTVKINSMPWKFRYLIL
jgi:hypothetical protein